MDLMNQRSNLDLNKPRQRIRGLRAWLGLEVGGLRAWLIVLAIVFFPILMFRVLNPDIELPPSSFDDWMILVYFTLLGSVAFATVYIGIIFIAAWVWRRLNFRRFLIGLACFAALIALFYAEENWKGKHEWEKFKRQCEAHGESFDRDSVVPQLVPDDQNFAMSPVWIAELRWNFQIEPGLAKVWYGNRIYSDEVSNYCRLVPISVSAVVVTNYSWMDSLLPNTPDTVGDWAVARMTDLGPWQSYYRSLEQTNPSVDISITPRPQTSARDVLLALSKYDPLIERLRRDSRLPYSRFPIVYNNSNSDIILLPQLNFIEGYTKVLELRAIAELQNGQSDKALADVDLMLRLANAERTEPFLISHLIRIAVLQIAIQSIYEGLANHEWSDSELAELDSELSKFDFLTDYKFSMRGDMIVSTDGTIEFLRRQPGHLFDMVPLRSGDDDTMDTQPLPARAMGNLIPSGWFYQNEFHDDSPIEEFYLPIADTNHEIISPASVRHAEAVVEAGLRHAGPYNVLEMAIRGFPEESVRFAYGQTAANLTRVAIALERCRFAHGKYPDSLDTLVPQFIARLPHDIINGQPLHYRRTADGQFLLYSVGWNETDDGGKVVLFKSASPPDMDRKQGDWVWRYPEK